MGIWEVRCLFGNEYALDSTIEILKKNGIENAVKLDRRYLSVRFERRDREREEMVKRIVETNHGFIESEAPLGEYDKELARIKMKKLRHAEKKKRSGH